MTGHLGSLFPPGFIGAHDQQAYSALAQQSEVSALRAQFMYGQQQGAQPFVATPPPDPRAYIGKVTAKPGFIITYQYTDVQGRVTSCIARRKVVADYPWRDRLVIHGEMFKEWMSH